MKPRIHYSEVKRKRMTSQQPSLTQQDHAEKLLMSNMVKKGFQWSEKQPIFGDFTNIPDLATLTINSRRLQQIWLDLPNRVKALIPNVDELMRVLKRNDEDELVEKGLLSPSDEYRKASALKKLEEAGIDINTLNSKEEPEASESSAEDE